jgi:hypothetical protein
LKKQTWSLYVYLDQLCIVTSLSISKIYPKCDIRNLDNKELWVHWIPNLTSYKLKSIQLKKVSCRFIQLQLKQWMSIHFQLKILVLKHVLQLNELNILYIEVYAPIINKNRVRKKIRSWIKYASPMNATFPLPPSTKQTHHRQLFLDCTLWPLLKSTSWIDFVVVMAPTYL